MPTPAEVRASSLNWAFANRKAKRELGWSTSPHEDCLEETIAFYRERDRAPSRPPARSSRRRSGSSARWPAAFRRCGVTTRTRPPMAPIV